MLNKRLIVLPKIFPRNRDQQRHELYNSLLRAEAKYGGELFGPVPAGRRREFFCLDQHTWVWHEEWVDAQGQRQVTTTHYHVRPTGVVKSQGSTYSKPSAAELRNFYRATSLYLDRVTSNWQQQLHAA